MVEMTISERLAETAASLAGLEPSVAAFRACRNLLADTLGVALAGKDQPGVDEARALLFTHCRTGNGAVVLYTGDRLPPWDAAYINSAMTHALDFDDGHPEANCHLMSMVVPASLAAASLVRCDGPSLQRAVIVGVEIAARLARWYLKRAKNRMWLTSSIVGGFGAVAAAALVAGLSTDELANAFGIYLSLASGTRQALVEHTLTKRLQPANAARSAVWAVLCARQGIDGPRQVIEGDGGLVALYAGSDDASNAEHLYDAPGERWEIEAEHVKRYPTCGAHHPAMHAALQMHQQLSNSTTNVRSVEVFIGRDAEQLVGGSFCVGGHPQTDAQFSAAYAIAYCLVHGRFGLAAIRSEVVGMDPRVNDIASRVEFLDSWDEEESGERSPAGFPASYYRGQLVRVRLADGTSFEGSATRVPVFAPYHAPVIQDADLELKLEDCAAFAGVEEPGFGKRVLVFVDELAAVIDVDAVFAALVPAGTAKPQDEEVPRG